MSLKGIGRGAFLAYVLTLAYFGFRPFHSIPGRQYPRVAPAQEMEDGGRVLRKGAALEARGAASVLRRPLMKTGCMSLEIVLKTDSLDQVGPARIISFSREAMSRNFTLGQEGDGLIFRLRTTETDYNGQYLSLRVPSVLHDVRWQHFIVTFDGTQSRLYVDGKPHPQVLKLGGNFSNWGRNHVLVVGDEVPGGRPWNGTIRRFAIYDRALDADEVERRFRNQPIPPPIFAPDASALERLRYRNLFVSTDAAAFDVDDCIINIVGFVPLAGMAWWAFPARLRRKRFLSGVLVPIVLGLIFSGVIEFAQRGIMGRVPCLVDLIYNGFGTLLGSALVWLGSGLCLKSN